jgi:hypothetical protein
LHGIQSQEGDQLTTVEGKVNSANVATRFAALVSKMVRDNRGEAVGLNLAFIARQLGCTKNYLQKMTVRARERAWLFQGYGMVLFVRQVSHRRARCGVPRLYAVSRHKTIWGQPPRVRWHLRKKSWEQWEDYRCRLKNQAFALIFRKSNRADGTHKGLKPQIEDRKIRRQTANRPRWRAFLKLAAYLDKDYGHFDPGSGFNVRGWAARRLSEGHRYGIILHQLKRAQVDLKRRMFDNDGNIKWMPRDIPSWICGVARNHLEWDGLTPFIRWREQGRAAKRHRAHARTFKVEKTGLRSLVEWDRSRESLRRRKTLPDGTEMEYDPKIGYWIEL